MMVKEDKHAGEYKKYLEFFHTLSQPTRLLPTTHNYVYQNIISAYFSKIP